MVSMVQSSLILSPHLLPKSPHKHTGQGVCGILWEATVLNLLFQVVTSAGLHQTFPVLQGPGCHSVGGTDVTGKPPQKGA